MSLAGFGLSSTGWAKLELEPSPLLELFRMQSQAKTAVAYLAELDDDRRTAISAVRQVILANLPAGYEEVMQFGMIAYVVPFSLLAKTYNRQPLMYLALASQKQYMSLYLTNVYVDAGLLDWLQVETLPTHCHLYIAEVRQRVQAGELFTVKSRP